MFDHYFNSKQSFTKETSNHTTKSKNWLKHLLRESRKQSHVFFQFSDQTKRTASCLLVHLIHSTTEVREGLACKPCAAHDGAARLPSLLSLPMRRRALSMHAKACLPLFENMPSCREVHLIVHLVPQGFLGESVWPLPTGSACHAGLGNPCWFRPFHLNIVAILKKTVDVSLFVRINLMIFCQYFPILVGIISYLWWLTVGVYKKSMTCLILAIKMGS